MAKADIQAYIFAVKYFKQIDIHMDGYTYIYICMYELAHKLWPLA